MRSNSFPVRPQALFLAVLVSGVTLLAGCGHRMHHPHQLKAGDRFVGAIIVGKDGLPRVVDADGKPVEPDAQAKPVSIVQSQGQDVFDIAPLKDKRSGAEATDGTLKTTPVALMKVQAVPCVIIYVGGVRLRQPPGCV